MGWKLFAERKLGQERRGKERDKNATRKKQAKWGWFSKIYPPTTGWTEKEKTKVGATEDQWTEWKRCSSQQKLETIEARRQGI